MASAVFFRKFASLLKADGIIKEIMMRIMLVVLGLLLLTAGSAHAYVGPGLGVGAIGAIIGVILTVLFAIFGIFYYPIKRLIKNYRNKDKVSVENETAQNGKQG